LSGCGLSRTALALALFKGSPVLVKVLSVKSLTLKKLRFLVYSMSYMPVNIMEKKKNTT